MSKPHRHNPNIWGDIQVNLQELKQPNETKYVPLQMSPYLSSAKSCTALYYQIINYTLWTKSEFSLPISNTHRDCGHSRHNYV